MSDYFDYVTLDVNQDLMVHLFKDAIHTHFVTLMSKWTTVGGWVKHRANKRGKVTKLKYKSFVTSLERTDKKTGWVGKKHKVDGRRSL